MTSPSPDQPRAGRPPRVLFFTRILPQAGSSGAGTYTFDLLSYLEAQGCEIRVVWTEIPYEFEVAFHSIIAAETVARFDVRAKGCYRFGRHLINPSAVWLPFKARLFHAIKTALGPLWRPRRAPAATTAKATAPSAVARPKNGRPAWGAPCTGEELACLRDHADAFQPDILFANYTWMLAGLDSLARRPQVWVLTHDYRFRRCRLTPEGVFEKNIVRGPELAKEHRWLEVADVIVAIQENEAALFRESVPGNEVITACMTAAMAPAIAPSDLPICAFVGSCNTINAAAAQWFADHVWPLVLETQPNARFRIAGRVCEAVPALASRPSIELLGLVDSIADFYGSAAVVVVPLLEGSGVKIKLLEAVAHHRTCVTTSVGLDGLEMLRPALTVADRPDVFAAAVIRLLANPGERRALAASARALAEKHLTPDACYGPLVHQAHRAVQPRA